MIRKTLTRLLVGAVLVGPACLIIALTQCGDDVDRQIELLTAQEWTARERAAVLLGTLGDPRGAGPLLSCLKDGDVHMRDVACEALIALGRPAVPNLLLYLDDDDPFVRERVIAILTRIGDPQAVVPLVRCMERAYTLNDFISDPDDDTRFAATEALGTLADARAVEPLRRRLKDVSPDRRSVVQDALRKILTRATGR